MYIIASVVILFAAMVLLPVLASTLHYKRNKSDVLFINQDKTRDPRYFGKSFAALIGKNLNTAAGGKITLSREENYVTGSQVDYSGEKVETLVIANEAFKSPQKTVFEKEIYGSQNVEIGAGSDVRAVYSTENIILENDTSVVRWVDAEGTVAAYDNCDLGISITSNSRLSIGKNCQFQRIFAPEICLGQYPEALGEPVVGVGKGYYPIGVRDVEERHIKYVNKEMANDEGFVDSTIISSKNITVTEGIKVRGDLRSHKGVRLCAGSMVTGNVFAETDIMLEKGAAVFGNIFSQGNVYLSEGATVGKKGAISSIIVRDKMEVEPGVFVYGYVSCEKGGMVLSMGKDAYAGAYTYLEPLPVVKILTFETLAEYEDVDLQGFRFHTEIEEVIIPEGATSIPESMFFACTSLKKVTIPASVEEIGAYAFAGCTELSDLNIAPNNKLRQMGVECFRDCENLPNSQIPVVPILNPKRGVVIVR